MTTDASVSLHEGDSDVSLGGWSDGYVPREREVIELPGGKRYLVRTVLYRLTRAPGSLHAVLTAFVTIDALWVMRETRQEPQQQALPTKDKP